MEVDKLMKRDYIFLNSNRDKWRFIIFLTLFVPAFLLIFQPFGVNNFDPKNTITSTFLLSMLGFGLVIGLSLTFFEFVLARIILKKNTLRHFITKWILELVFLSFTVFLYYNVMGGFHDWHFISFLSFVFNIGMMALIPFAIVFLFYLNKEKSKSLEQLAQQPKLSIEDKFISLYSYNKKEKITILLKDLLFVEAQDNYVKIYFIEKDTVKTKLLRNKLSGLEEDLKNYGIIRCHRSYIINSSIIERVIQSGNKTQIILKKYPNPISVSRSYMEEIDTIFSTRHK